MGLSWVFYKRVTNYLVYKFVYMSDKCVEDHLISLQKDIKKQKCKVLSCHEGVFKLYSVVQRPEPQ